MDRRGMDPRSPARLDMTSATAGDPRTISTLVGDALSQFTKLFQNEIDLAKAEFGEKAEQVGNAAKLLACGAMFVIPAIVMALFALSAALVANNWSPASAYLVSAVLAAVVSGGMLAAGASKFSAINMKPSETLHQLEKDKQAIKGFAR